MSSKLALRLPSPVSSPRQTPSLPATAAAAATRRSSAPIHQRLENNDTAAEGLTTSSATEMKKQAAYMVNSPAGASASKSGSKKPQPQQSSASVAFPAIEYLLQRVEDAVYGGVFQSASEHRLLDLVGSAKREMKGQAQRIAMLEQRNEALEDECRRYQTSMSKIQTQSEHLRRSSNGKDPQLEQLVSLLREIHGYEAPELPEDEQQQLKSEPVAEGEGEESSGDDEDQNCSGSSCDESDSNQTEDEQTGDDKEIGEALEPAQNDDDEGEGELVPYHLRESELPCASARERCSLGLLVEPQTAVVFVPAIASSIKPASDAKVSPHAMLSVTVAEPMKKSVQAPKPPRGSSSSGVRGGTGSALAKSSGSANGSRLKFQFPESGVSGFLDEDDDDDDPRGVYETKADRPRAGVADAPSLSSPARQSYLQRRRFSSSAVISTTVPLRRKSFTMKRSPAKRIAVTTDKELGPAADTAPIIKAAAASPSAGPSRWTARRKSTSACYSPMRAASRSPAKWKLDPKTCGSVQDSSSSNASSSNGAVLASPRSSQMVVRVRERKLDGIPELVIRKKPARFVVWQWNERQVRIPVMIQLGPQQHGIMLRQLRYVKSVMHDFPWAKAHLKDLLSCYTKKDMTKEQLYPQLNYLSHHVQEEIGSKAKKQRQLAAKKHHLTLQLTIAAGVVNDMRMVKFGRRGKPHDTKLCYDPSDPTRLHWLRKNGDKSDEFLPVDDIAVRSNHAQFDSSVIKRAARKYPLDPECCVSLVTGVRSLDLQLKSPLQRDWLLNALQDIISFAKQYKAAGVMGRRQQSQKDLRSMTALARR